MLSDFATEQTSIDVSQPTESSDVLSTHRKYIFGIQGQTLRTHISLAGAFGFLLFGYDQGVLGVSFSILEFLGSFNLDPGPQCFREFPSSIQQPFSVFARHY